MEQNNSILEAIRKYAAGFPYIRDIDLLHIDQTDEEPSSYAVTTSGLIKLSEDILGNQRWQYNAVLQSRDYTCDDLSRLDAHLFTEQFIFWIEKQNKAENFPELPEGMKPESIWADNGMLLSVDDDGDRGLYQIQIHLIFNIEEEI